MMHAEAAAAGEKQPGDNGSLFKEGTVSLEAVKSSASHIPHAKLKAARKSYKQHRGIAYFNGDLDSVSFKLPKDLGTKAT